MQEIDFLIFYVIINLIRIYNIKKLLFSLNIR